MGFTYQLFHPPCHASFIAVIDGPALFSSEESAGTRTKEATIKQIAWQEIQIPPEWFFSERAHHHMMRVCATMQCTIQYLLYRQKLLHDELTAAQSSVKEIQEERDRVFEALVELRELTALERKKQREREATRRANQFKRMALADGTIRRLHCCELCGNCYPSLSSLQSHMAKRHDNYHQRVEKEDILPAEQARSSVPMSNVVLEELTSVKRDLAYLREASAVAQRKDAQREVPASVISSADALALLADNLRTTTSAPASTSDNGLKWQQEQQGMIIKMLQDELKMTKTNLFHLQSVIHQWETARTGALLRCDVPMQTTSTEAPRSTASFVDKLHEATHHFAPSPSSSIRNFVGKVPPASTSVVTQGSQSVVRGETQEESAHTGSSNTVAPHCDDALHDPSYGSFSVTHKKQGVGPKSSGTPGLPPFSEHSMANTSDSQRFDAGLPAVTCSAAIKSGSDAQGNDVILDNKRNIGTPTSEISESIPMFLNMTKGSKCNSVLLSGSASVCRGIASEKGDIAITCSPKDAFETLIAKVDSFVGSSKENKTVSSLNATSVSSTPSVGGDSDQRHSDSSLYSSLSSRRLSGTRSGFY